MHKAKDGSMTANIPVQLKILNENIREFLPKAETAGAAGVDLRAAIAQDLTILPGETHLIPTGLAMFLDDARFAALILPRSGLGHKHGMVLGNLVGLIDSDYQGELMVSMWNRGDQAFVLRPLERMAQLVIVPVMRADFSIVDEFIPSERGAGGFGSTGLK